ncbi:bacterioferritin (cytochrome b1) [Streptomyces griseochromogenes]|uniref:Bacterioferritin (Cytochrome b1) n=2 Tax=Streptomyces griseochromogenes TaxID=68214 RepID=A0ABS4LXR9_9ACTN|nr:hypothetical protein [Streptomyces griseochromogenes]MBP2052022.1 bacterioferritin (cytochrome b1) [Streptomyces griseochromogenes]
MAVATDMLVPALREVRKAEAALADRFRTHVTVTPAGEYREILERRMGDARGHMYLIDERLNSLKPHGLADTVAGNVWHFTKQAALLPLEVGRAVPGVLMRGRGTATAHQMLKNVEEEYALTAFAVAICRVAERIAQKAQDGVSSDLLCSIRHDGEETLEELGRSLEQHAESAVVAAEGLGAGGAARAMREWGNWLRETAERMPGVHRLSGAPAGALMSDMELPISDYRRLGTRMILDRLPQLSQTDLATVGVYERSHAARPAVLGRIADLLGPEPWPGYDAMHEDEILKRLGEATERVTRRVLEYERRHQARSTVLMTAEGVPA